MWLIPSCIIITLWVWSTYKLLTDPVFHQRTTAYFYAIKILLCIGIANFFAFPIVVKRYHDELFIMFIENDKSVVLHLHRCENKLVKAKGYTTHADYTEAWKPFCYYEQLPFTPSTEYDEDIELTFDNDTTFLVQRKD